MSSAPRLEWYVDDEPDGWLVDADEVETVPRPATDEAASAPDAGVDHAVVAEIRRAVVERLAVRLQSTPVTDAVARRELARTLVGEVLSARALQRAHAGLVTWTIEEEMALGEAVMAALFGLGRLQPLVDDEEIENIEANGCDDVWLSYADGRQERGPAIATSDDELVELIQNLGARMGASERTFTTASPSLHLRLDDGSRLAAVAWTTPRPQLVIRRHRIRDVDLTDLVHLGTIDTGLAAFLRAALRSGKNIIVTGLQNAGKTTLIRALANEFDPIERFATIEREYELHLHDLPHRHPRVVAMEAREGSSERDGAGRRSGEVTLSELVIDALRLNLRRIIVGEVGGAEVLPMLEAMSTGDGSLCTLHARSAHHAFDRLVTLCLSAGVGMTDTFAYRLAAGAVDLVVHIDLVDDTGRTGRRLRHVSEVVEVAGIGELGRPVMTTVFSPGADGRAVPRHRPECLADLVRAGFDVGFFDHAGGTWDAPGEGTSWAR